MRRSHDRFDSTPHGAPHTVIRRHQAAERGFTLIELLVVIGLLGLIAVAVMPFFTQAQDQEQRTRAEVIVNAVVETAKKYERQRSYGGDYPPDDYKDRSSSPIKIDAGNGVNVGIESLIFFVNRGNSRSGPFPEGEFPSTGNTDEDKSTVRIEQLERNERLEILDPWGNPLAYFHKRNYGQEQNYRMGAEGAPEGHEEQVVMAWKDGTRYLNPRTFQVFSAGPDGIFNTPDDIGNFETPED